MKGHKCPVCNRYSYFKSEGEWEGYLKLSLDVYYCTKCGFRYYEDLREEYSEELEAKRYKMRINRDEYV